MNCTVRTLCAALLAAVLGPAACSEQPSKEAAHGAHEDPLPLPFRLALMTGHVKAGLALYRAGEPAMAAPHLLHPVSETHAAEREGLDAYGFNGALFETVSAALKEGRTAADIEPQLQVAEENLALVARKAGGDPAAIIAFLMNNVVEEYEIAVTDGVVTDVGEYQDAYGFSLVALERAEQLNDETVKAALSDLIAVWPASPAAAGSPAPIDTVRTKAEAVRAALAGT